MQKKLYKPRRAVNKSYDFGRSSGLSKQISDASSVAKYSAVGSRFSFGAQAVWRGGQGERSPPRMVCYRPRMDESNLVSSLERYLTDEGMYRTMHDSTFKQNNHTTKPLRGFNDVSRFTWSSI